MTYERREPIDRFVQCSIIKTYVLYRGYCNVIIIQNICFLYDLSSIVYI